MYCTWFTYPDLLSHEAAPIARNSGLSDSPFGPNRYGGWGDIICANTKNGELKDSSKFDNSENLQFTRSRWGSPAVTKYFENGCHKDPSINELWNWFTNIDGAHRWWSAISG